MQALFLTPFHRSARNVLDLADCGNMATERAFAYNPDGHNQSYVT